MTCATSNITTELMKKHFLFSANLILNICLFVSCNSNIIEDSNTSNQSDSIINYWNSSTLIHQHLNGKVKTIVSNNDKQTDTYNEAGYITSSSYNDYGLITSNYIYDSTGVLNSINESFVILNKTYSTTYKYLNTGKFVVVEPFDLTTFGLIFNLNSLTYNRLGATIDYEFNGNTLLLISTYANNKDTAIITYNGQYPTDIKWYLSNDLSHTKDIVYYGNGMFKTFTNETSGTDNLNQNKYYFRPDKKFQLLDSVVTTNYTQSKTKHSTEKYSYDSNRNVIHHELPDLIKDCTYIYDYTYVYDSHNNWISKTTISRNSTNLNGYLTIQEPRTITYW